MRTCSAVLEACGEHFAVHIQCGVRPLLAAAPLHLIDVAARHPCRTSQEQRVPRTGEAKEAKA
jgi:hypothetical protein